MERQSRAEDKANEQKRIEGWGAKGIDPEERNPESWHVVRFLFVAATVAFVAADSLRDQSNPADGAETAGLLQHFRGTLITTKPVGGIAPA